MAHTTFWRAPQMVVQTTDQGVPATVARKGVAYPKNRNDKAYSFDALNGSS